MVRTSRRNQDLSPEFEPVPTSPIEEDRPTFEIETEEEERERREREDREEALEQIRRDKERRKQKRSIQQKDDIIEEDINFDEEIQFELEDDEDSEKSSSSIKTQEKEESISLEVAKMALTMGNTKIVERFLKSLENETGATSTSTNPLKNYKSGQVSTSELRAFTLYWDNHLKKLNIYFKLTIFNDRWIELDQMVDGNSTSSKKKDKPTGQPAKSEWWMTYADWTRAKSLMLKYLIDTYKHIPFAKGLEKHFLYVEKLSLRHSWITAFRYDIMVRSDVLCNRVNGAPGDPSVPRENFLEEAKARTELLQDGRLILLDNPYAKGNLKEKFSPLTGKKYPEGIDHDSFDTGTEELEVVTLEVPSFNRNNSFERNNNFNRNNNHFRRNESYQENNFRRSDNYQNNNRRNNRGKNLRRELSPSPYHRPEKYDPKSKGKNVDKANVHDDSLPRQSTSKDKL